MQINTAIHAITCYMVTVKAQLHEIKMLFIQG